jgi:hypothetical protein
MRDAYIAQAGKNIHRKNDASSISRALLMLHKIWKLHYSLLYHQGILAIVWFLPTMGTAE